MKKKCILILMLGLANSIFASDDEELCPKIDSCRKISEILFGLDGVIISSDLCGPSASLLESYDHVENYFKKECAILKQAIKNIPEFKKTLEIILGKIENRKKRRKKLLSLGRKVCKGNLPRLSVPAAIGLRSKLSKDLHDVFRMLNLALITSKVDNDILAAHKRVKAYLFQNNAKNRQLISQVANEDNETNKHAKELLSLIDMQEDSINASEASVKKKLCKICGKTIFA